MRARCRLRFHSGGPGRVLPDALPPPRSHAGARCEAGDEHCGLYWRETGIVPAPVVPAPGCECAALLSGWTLRGSDHIRAQRLSDSA